MKSFKYVALAIALLGIFSSCKKDENGKDLYPGVKIKIVECNPFSNEIYVLYNLTVPEDFQNFKLAGIAVSDPESIKDYKSWKNLNSTRADFINDLPAESGTNKFSAIPLTPNTEYMVVVAVLDEGTNFLKISEPKYVKTTAPVE